ncbi:carcinine hydrolase/isopenicillin-N N-acyltransferase family protein [Endozoicomonas sp. SCSIO W0465]|uniref:carcinine hydrolase/isopenicillin-N N-acyltransferase family protein n=1 Tax=Endozoicomonas sp. SCSIO W0465 TaxID=2918516 RepID=UPI002075D5D4|nr:carcinine hydrolase/isopenicillin-N N-acyltransferase family protein [Endozoicomonas sp. SCSIO W0465]USE37669.1 C45 family peptidase [Endozoicomonas sp. SCSIO W0465]
MPMSLKPVFAVGSALIFTTLLIQPITTNACTTFASVGAANANNGLIIAKNRDSTQGFEQLAVRKQAGKNTYLGLFFNTDDQQPYPLISAGINEYGLSVVQNESVAITSAQQAVDAPHGSAVIFNVLEGYSSVADVLADQQALFGNGYANFLIIGDQTEAILVEIGPEENAYQILRASDNNNRVYHTNHYVLQSMRSYNKVFYPDSEDRFATIKKLMTGASAQLTAEGNYYQWINSAQNGQYNSMFRNMTVASWIAEIPQNGTPELLVRLTSPNVKYQQYSIQLTPEFWNHPPTTIQPFTPSFAGLQGEPVNSQQRYTYSATEL